MATKTLADFTKQLIIARKTDSMLSVGIGPSLVHTLADKLIEPRNEAEIDDVDQLMGILHKSAEAEASVQVHFSPQLSRAIILLRDELNAANAELAEAKARIAGLEVDMPKPGAQTDH